VRFRTVLLATSLLAAPSFAEPLVGAAAGAADDGYQEILVTAARDRSTTLVTFGAPIKEVPVTVNVVTEELIRDTSALRLRDLLDYVPGVNATETNGATGDSLIIRGFQTTRRVSVNGLRRPLDYDNQSTDLALVERIEVVKGPAGLEFGVSEPGGNVNFITKKPQDEFAAELRASAGSFDTYDAVVDVTGPMAGGLAYRLVAHGADAGSFRDTLNSDRFSLAPSLMLRYGTRSSLLVEGGVSRQDQPYDRGTFYLEDAPADAGFRGNFAPIERSFHEPDDFLRSTLWRGAVYWTQELTAALTFNAAVDALLDDFDSEGARNPNLNALYQPGTNRYRPLVNGQPNRTVARSFTDFWAERSGYTAQADVTGEVEFGDVRLDAKAGASHIDYRSRQRGQDGQTRWNIDAFAPVYGTAPVVLGTPATVGRDFVNDDDVSETGLFAQGRVALFDRFRLSGGVRRDSFESENRYIDNVTRGTALQTTRLEDSNTSWRVGASADLTRQVTLFTGASRNFVPQTGRLRAGNAPVPALRATSYEAGVKAARLFGGLSGTLSLFRITQANQTVADAANRPGESFVELVGTVRVQGVETELSADLGAGLSLFAGGSYLGSEIRTRGAQFGNRLFNTPEWDGFVRVTYDFETIGLPGFAASLGVVHTGDRFGNNANNFVLPAYTRVDAGLYYDGPRFGAKLTVENLFDETYYLGSQNRPQNIAPGSPRFVTVGASVKW